MTADADKIGVTLQIALCHLFFNITGIMIWYPIPMLRRLPIYLAKRLGLITSQYRWFAVAYVLFFFFVLPGSVFALSLAGVWVLVGVGVPLVALVLFIVVVNILQSKRPHCLPGCLQNWNCLPLCLRSLDPMDSCVSAVCANSYCRKCCSCCFQDEIMERGVKKRETGMDHNINVIVEEHVEGKIVDGQFEAFECHL